MRRGEWIGSIVIAPRLYHNISYFGILHRTGTQGIGKLSRLFHRNAGWQVDLQPDGAFVQLRKEVFTNRNTEDDACYQKYNRWDNRLGEKICSQRLSPLHLYTSLSASLTSGSYKACAACDRWHKPVPESVRVQPEAPLSWHNSS